MDQLYEVEWNGSDDYIPDVGLDRIGEHVERLPVDGFEVASIMAHKRSVTVTLKFTEVEGPEAQRQQLEAVLRASTAFRTLHANLVAARAALTKAKRA